ncbi:MAG: FxLYD domain-containing protein [gamma proteobacterium symbiont of Taylorina sp.]|nr:FxLYD domain-containing protein [gamma proteobacterium symbiont of Taylorina sp.]
MEDKICAICLEHIHVNAKKCPKCQSYQNPGSRFFHSSLGQWVLTIVFIIALFSWFDSDHFEDDIIYNLDGILEVDKSSFKVQNSDCGIEVTILGTIANKSDKPLTNIILDVEFFDANGDPIDLISEELWDITVPPKGEKRFKISSNTSKQKISYIKHVITITQAEPSGWF